MATLLLVTIHNGEFASSPAAEVVQQIKNLEPTCVTLEVTDQAPLTHQVDLEELRAWGHLQWRLERDWRRYRGVSSAWRELFAWAGHTWWATRLRLSRRFREIVWQTRQIEQRVTSKHIAAWRSLEVSDHGVAIVLESDASWIPGTSQRIAGIAQRVDPLLATYVNFAGGLHETELLIARLRTVDRPMDEGLSTFTRPVSNTSCAYLVSRTLAGEFLTYLGANAAHASLGVDWLVNAIFMDVKARGVSIVCAHAEPPLLLHGSQVGLTRSWHPAR